MGLVVQIRGAPRPPRKLPIAHRGVELSQGRHTGGGCGTRRDVFCEPSYLGWSGSWLEARSSVEISLTTALKRPTKNPRQPAGCAAVGGGGCTHRHDKKSEAAHSQPCRLGPYDAHLRHPPGLAQQKPPISVHHGGGPDPGDSLEGEQVEARGLDRLLQLGGLCVNVNRNRPGRLVCGTRSFCNIVTGGLRTVRHVRSGLAEDRKLRGIRRVRS
jgi:hypothetical protein